MTGIVSYGAYVPKWRLDVSEIASVWKKDAGEISSSLGVTTKSVAAVDEDAVTIAYEAARQALDFAPLSACEIGALLVGSESHPYAVNPTSTTVGEFLGIGNNYLAADLQFACKAGTAGMQAISGLVAAGQVKYGLAIGSDAAQSKPHDALEYTSAAAGAAFILGRENLVAEIEAFVSYSSDTPDFWRRDGIRFPSHAGRFTGEPAYFRHVQGAAELLLEKTGLMPADMSYCVFHMPNGKFPHDVARRLGFCREQLAPSLTVDTVGNPYSASAMLGLAAVLDIAKPGDKIFLVSYGSGAGSDGFFFRVTEGILPLRKKRKIAGVTVAEIVNRHENITYPEYLKMTHKI